METTLQPTTPWTRLRATRLSVSAESVALGSLAVVGLHVVDDSFLQPEPGTSALDHLAGGLISVAALGLAAVGLRHGRAGLRATIALVTGLFARVIAAGSAGYTTITV